MSGPEEQQVEIAPIGGRGGGTARRAWTVAATLIVFVLVAVAKPWDGAAPEIAPLPRTSIAPQASAAERPADQAIGVPRPPPDEPTVAAAVRPHDAWGIRAIVAEPVGVGRRGGFALVERWTSLPDGPAPGAAQQASSAQVLELLTGGAPVVGLGFTTPDLEVPLDVRIWRLVPGAIPERITPSTRPGEPGRPVWLARDRRGTVLGAWPAGTYRFDLLGGGRIARVLVRVPGEPVGVVPPWGDRDWRPTAGALERLSVLGEEPASAVAAVLGSRAIALPAATGRSADELTSWADPHDAIAEPPPSGRVFGAEAEAIAWLPAPGTERRAVRLTMLAPVERRFTLDTTRITVPTTSGPRTAWLLRWATDRSLPAGVYRIETAWAEADGRVGRSSWHLDLEPARDYVPGGTLMRATGRWRSLPQAPDAAEVTQRGLLTAADRFEGDAIARPAGACAERLPVEPGLGALGLAGLGDRAITGVEVARLFEDALRVPMRVGIARDGRAGTVLLAAPREGWRPGAYRINVRFDRPDASGFRTRTFLACVGTRSGPVLSFRPATTDLVRG